MGTDKSFVPFQRAAADRDCPASAWSGWATSSLSITNKPDDYAHLGLPMVR
jgi:hypothetical protein